MKDWRKIQRELLKKKNVVAVGRGCKKIGDVMYHHKKAIVCSVVKKEPLDQLKKKDLIPKSVGGELTDVVETGVIRALKARTDRWRPAPGGVSIGHESISAGTLGCLVKKVGQTFILSNNHVLADSNNAPIGGAILQPGKHDGGTMIDRIAVLSEFVPIEFIGLPSDCPIGKMIAGLFNAPAVVAKRQTRLQAVKTEQIENLVDAAIARPVDDSVVKREILEIGVPAGIGEGALGMKIQKSGRTTGLTNGEILQVDAMVTVSYGDGKTALFVDQFIAGAMSSGGDSGSAVLDLDKNIIGLLFAGSDTSTIINSIQHVFELLSLEAK